MTTFFEVLATGLIATLAMTGVIALLHGASLSMSDMIRAIGSIFTSDHSKTFRVGLIVHLTVGCASAFFYVAIWSMFEFSGFLQYALLGTIAGLGQGLLTSIVLIRSVSEHHPLARFRNLGFGIGVVFLAAHIVYGLTVGLGAGAFDPRFEAVERVAKLIVPGSAG